MFLCLFVMWWECIGGHEDDGKWFHKLTSKICVVRKKIVQCSMNGKNY